jgi:hypothetical protein
MGGPAAYNTCHVYGYARWLTHEHTIEARLGPCRFWEVALSVGCR